MPMLAPEMVHNSSILQCNNRWAQQPVMNSYTTYSKIHLQYSDSTQHNWWTSRSAVNPLHINGVQKEQPSCMHNLKQMLASNLTWKSSFFRDTTPALSNKIYPLQDAQSPVGYDAM
jgi:hypothetical protein